MNRDLVSGEFMILLCCAVIGVAYPVTPDVDYPHKDHPGHFYSKLFADKNAKMSVSLMTGYDCHYVPVAVNPRYVQDDYQACDPDEAEYHKIVVSHKLRAAHRRLFV